MDHAIRPARADDSPALAELTLMATDGIVEAIFDGLVPGALISEIVERRIRATGTTNSHQNCWVVEQAGRIIAMLHAYPMDDLANEPPDPLVPEERYVVVEPFDHLDPHAESSYYINIVAVEAASQGRGIGSELIAFVRGEAERRGFETLSLVVFEENQRAVRLYQRLGFAEAARHPAAKHPRIRHGGDLLMMLARVG